MEPVTLIVAALAAGAATGTTDAAAAAVREAYAGLRDLLRRRVGRHPEVNAALEGHVSAPVDDQDRLAALLSETGVGGDAEVVAAAQRLMALVDPPGARQGKYVVDLREAKGTIVGDHGTMFNKF